MCLPFVGRYYPPLYVHPSIIRHSFYPSIICPVISVHYSPLVLSLHSPPLFIRRLSATLFLSNIYPSVYPSIIRYFHRKWNCEGRSQSMHGRLAKVRDNRGLIMVVDDWGINRVPNNRGVRGEGLFRKFCDLCKGRYHENFRFFSENVLYAKRRYQTHLERSTEPEDFLCAPMQLLLELAQFNASRARKKNKPRMAIVGTARKAQYKARKGQALMLEWFFLFFE